MNKKQTKSIAPYIAMGVLTLLIVGSFAFAQYQEYQTAKVVNVAGDYIEAPMEVVIEEQLGAISSPNIMSRWMIHNDLMTYIESGEMADGTNTLVSFINPFNGVPTSTTDARFNKAKYYTATATVDLIQLTITEGSTTTGKILCGPSANQYGDPAYNHLETGAFDVTTGTTAMIENNASGSYGTNVITGGSVAKSTLNQVEPWYTCKVYVEDLDAYIGDTNNFEGKFKARIYKGL